MARPKNKAELVDLAQKNYTKLITLVENFSVEQQHENFSELFLNKNIRDVLTHVHHWHLMFLKWYNVGMAGNKPEMPAKGYTWKTLPDLNAKIQAMYTTTNLASAKNFLEESFETVLKTIKSHSNEELFTKKKYPWTGSTSLGAYAISATSSHYDWATKLIKKAKN
jgi:hypothetical protein